MSVYKVTLPTVFPHLVQRVTLSEAAMMADTLASTSESTPSGSSFAMTADIRHSGFMDVYLSTTSLRRLREAGLMRGFRVFDVDHPVGGEVE